jgi:hypothetical protein
MTANMQKTKKNHSNSYLSPAVVPTGFILSLLLLLLTVSFFFINPLPLGTGSSVSLRRTVVLGKRTVCARNLSFVVFVRFVITFDPGGPPLALVFNDICPLLFDVDVSILADASKELIIPLVAVVGPLINE